MQSNSCIQDLAAFQVALTSHTNSRQLLSRNICQQLLQDRKREWFLSLVTMEGDTENSLSCKTPLEGSTSHEEVKRPTDNGATTSVFVNHGKPSALMYRIDCIRRSEKDFCSFDN